MVILNGMQINTTKNILSDNFTGLNNYGCFIVKNKDIEDYVLIDNKQNVIAGYPYTLGGSEQLLAKINIIKISKHYEENNI